jgi:glycosyltransferase involved in cell wall biosynthesis
MFPGTTIFAHHTQDCDGFMTQPFFSIVTPSFNQAEFIRATVESIVSQATAFAVEYEVRDNESTDATAAVMSEYADRVRFLRERDAGQADAINQGWHASSGRWLAWLNADDLYEPGALAAVAAAAEANPEARWIVGEFRIVDRLGRAIGGLHAGYKNFLLRRYSYSLLLSENIIPQMSVFIRRDLWQEAGDLRTDDQLAFDYEYWLRLGQICDPLVLPQCLSVFRYYRGTKTAENLKVQFGRELEYARRYAGRRRWPIWLHRANYWKTLLLYDLVKRW